MTPKEARTLARRLGGVAEKDDEGHWVILKRPGGNGADIIGWAEDFEVRGEAIYHLNQEVKHAIFERTSSESRK